MYEKQRGSFLQFEPERHFCSIMQTGVKYADLGAKAIAVEKEKKDSSCKSTPEQLYGTEVTHHFWKKSKCCKSLA